MPGLGYLDRANVRTCRPCGNEILRVYDSDDNWLMDVEPGAVWDGSTVTYGLRLEVLGGRRPLWLVHLGSVSPHAHCVFRAHHCVAVQPIASPTRGDKQVSQDNDDPFDKPESRPSVSFKGAPIGATITCVIDGAPNKVQARDFVTGQPETWKDGNPKFTVATDVLVNGQPMTLWAAIPGSLFAAIAGAQKEAGAKLAPGGTLVVKLTGEKPNDDPKLNAQKLYEAKYTAPDAFAAAGANADPWATATPAAEPAQAAAPAADAVAPPWAVG